MENLAIGSIVFGLAAASCFGIGDFFGGLATRRNNPYTVIFASQFAGTLLLIFFAFITQEAFPSWDIMLLGGIGGIFGCLGLNGLYRGLASGKMSIIAPVSAVMTALIPVLYSMITIGAPSAIKIFGFILALVAVWLISQSGTLGQVTWRDFVLPIFAGCCFGITFILVGETSKVATFWPLVALRGFSMAIMFVTATLTHQPYFPPLKNYPIVAIGGILDAGGNVFFVLANQAGRLDIATILSALYPAATVLLAWLVLKEHISRIQWFGIMLALTAIVVITV